LLLGSHFELCYTFALLSFKGRVRRLLQLLIIFAHLSFLLQLVWDT